MRLHILGSNSASPSHGRHPSSQILEINGRFFMFDCGEGTQFRLQEYKLSHNRIEAIFISHLHGDHYLGLLGLLTTMSMNMREKELYIISPNGLEEIINLQCHYSGTKLRFPIHYIQSNTEENIKIWENELFELYSLPMIHKIECSGYLVFQKLGKKNIIKDKIELYQLTTSEIISIKEGNDLVRDGKKIAKNAELTYQAHPPMSYAYCSDTMYNHFLPEWLKNIDTLYHEATFMESERARAIETKHSTAKDAATIAIKANVKKLIIGHFSSRYSELAPLLNEAKEIFKNTELAIEGQCIDL